MILKKCGRCFFICMIRTLLAAVVFFCLFNLHPGRRCFVVVRLSHTPLAACVFVVVGIRPIFLAAGAFSLFV